MTKNYFNSLDAVILVFDMTNGKSFEGVLRWFKQIKEAKEIPLILAYGHFPIVSLLAVE